MVATGGSLPEVGVRPVFRFSRKISVSDANSNPLSQSVAENATTRKTTRAPVRCLIHLSCGHPSQHSVRRVQEQEWCFQLLTRPVVLLKLETSYSVPHFHSSKERHAAGLLPLPLGSKTFCLLQR